MLSFLGKLHVLENVFFQNWHYFDNFHCTERVISIRSNLLQSKSTDLRTANGKLPTSNRSLTFAVNVDLKVLVLGDAVSIRDVCMDFEPYFKVHNLVSAYPKSIILGQMINLDMIFHVVVSVYRLVKI